MEVAHLLKSRHVLSWCVDSRWQLGVLASVAVGRTQGGGLDVAQTWLPDDVVGTLSLRVDSGGGRALVGSGMGGSM